MPKIASSNAQLPPEIIAQYAARETKLVTAIEKGLADARASHVTPHEMIARRIGVAPRAPGTPPAGRAVVWTDTGRADLIESMRVLQGLDQEAVPLIAAWIAGTAERLGDTATGVPSRLPFTYEKTVPGLGYILVFEIVTWTKAGEVIAILHLIDMASERAVERPI